MRKLVNTKFLKEKSRKYTSRTFPAYSNIYNKKIDYDKKNPYKKIVHPHGLFFLWEDQPFSLYFPGFSIRASHLVLQNYDKIHI